MRHVTKLGDKQLFHREPAGVGRTRQCNHDLAGRDSSQRSGQKRRRSDLLIGKIAEQFAEPLQFFVEERTDRLDGRVARCDSGPAVDDDRVEVLQLVEQRLADERGIVGPGGRG